MFMNRLARIVFIVLSSLGFLVIVWFAAVWFLFVRIQPYVPDPVYSQDGSRAIIPTVNFNKENPDTYLLVHIKIKDMKSGDTLFQVQTRASDRMRWSVYWINDKTFQLDSSDIGSYCWEEVDSTWMEAECP